MIIMLKRWALQNRIENKYGVLQGRTLTRWHDFFYNLSMNIFNLNLITEIYLELSKEAEST